MKKILSCMLLMLLLVSFVSCSPALSGRIEDIAEAVDSKYIDFAVVEQDHTDGWVILYDKNTKVMYIWLTTNCGGITPLYNPDGTLKLYEEQ